jgi:pimeloyl-ACP methyl ester carboxylesterase
MPDFFTFAREDGESIAYCQNIGKGAGILWLGGFRSDMTGSKAAALASWAGQGGRSFLRFDYFGHGSSSGDFRDGSISRWRDDALAVLDQLTDGPQILVGSSMGGWIASLLAHHRPERVAGMLLIAPAPDFTEDLIWARMPQDVRDELMARGEWFYQGADAYPITRKLIESGRENQVLNRSLAINGPVRILHGTADIDVPWKQGLRLFECIDGNATFTLVKGADHRMSEPSQLSLIKQVLEAIITEIEPC